MKSIEKIKNLAPHDRFRWCVRGVIRNHAKLAFFDLFDETFQRSLGYYFLLFIFGLISFGASYAMWTHVGDLAHQLFEFGVVMTYVQIFFKYYFANDFKELILVSDFINDVYRKQFSVPADKNENRQRLCNEYAKSSQSLMAGVIVVYVLLAGSDILIPIILYAMTGEVILTLGIELPAIDKTTAVGLAILIFCECRALSGIYCVATSFDLMVVFGFVNISLVSDIMTSYIHDLETDLSKGNCDSRATKRKLVDIISMQQKYNSIIDCLDEGLFKALLIQMFVAPIFSTIGIFSFIGLISGTIPTLTMTFYGLCQINSICALGSMLASSHSRYYSAVKCFDWHRLPKDIVPIYQQFLHNSQEPRLIFIAGIRELNLETSVSIMRGIYSFLTILQSLDV